VTRVLFVCTGNICRSPTAEGVFRAMIELAGVADRISCDSAGTHGYHIGELPDLRARQAARRRGYDLSSLRARRIDRSDFRDFDLMLAMDLENLAALSQMQPRDARITPALFLEYAGHPRLREVEDPYYGGAAGFEAVLDVIEDAAARLLVSLTAAKT
jgi:protein-tyrosine phosphatase